MTDEEMENSLKRHKLWQSGFDAGFKAGYESPRDWTPCAEGLPTPAKDERDCKVYLIAVERYDEIFPQLAIYRQTVDGAEWQTIEGYKHRYPAIAWKYFDPYNPDYIRDARKED